MNFWKDGLRLLCVRLDNLGDVLMTTPAFRAIKTTWPATHLTLLTSSAGAAVAELVPDIDQVLSFDVPWVAGQQQQPDRVISLADRLRGHNFDAAILFTVQSQNPLPTAMLCYLAGIPRLLGYCRENPYQLITDWVPDPEILVATRHEVVRQLELVREIGCQTSNRRLSLTPSIADQQRVRQQLTNAGLDFQRPWLVLHPGVSEEKRRYPAEKFVQALLPLMQDSGYQVVLTGSRQEQSLTSQIQHRLAGRALDLAGQLGLGELAALLAEAPLLLANNTGPVHMAAALGTPVVVLYAKTNPQHTPWQVPNRVLYFDVPANLRSKNKLLQQFPEPAEPAASPEAIVRAVHDLMAQWQPIA
ncbi:glycosyltransferase family 9 protein [Spirosoma sp.]|uniref:glycosyltransferase family 9 protein n=1 Tax=Spirosoma sp. TaxID=1899569 RepID=UPI002621CAF8|nr:glycosyltransferase family 9 protein [Spirosoma sp.]MCX6215322.1 glycosyltransferase family 9 protein [Spirosoma sp.]